MHMKKLHLLAILGVVAALALISTQALASVGASEAGLPQAPGGTHGPPATPTETPTVGPGTGTPTPLHPGGKPLMTPGAEATEQAGKPHGQPTILRGTLTNVSATSITLTLEDGTSQTVGLTTDTQIKVPGPKSEGDTLLNGMHVIVMAFPDQSNDLVARAVLVVPGQPVRVHRVGTVTAYSAGSSITIKATDGNTYTFALTSNTQILPSGAQVTTGALVTIIAPRDPSTLVWTATAIVVHASQ